MNLRMGSQAFVNVQIPLLWGSRAVIQDGQGKLSIINLAGDHAVLEVLEDEPAEGIRFAPRVGGFAIIEEGGTDVYEVNPTARTITPKSLALPPVTISPSYLKIGGSTLQNNMVSDFAVGVLVTETGLAIGAPLPPGLAALRV
jgi:hypothetical protein